MFNSSKKKIKPSEYLSNIHNEVSDSDVYEKYPNKRTLKSYVHNINVKVSKYIADKTDSRELEESKISWALGVLSFIAICFLTNSSQSDPDINWIKENQLALKLWGIALAGIYIGASFERSSFFKALWGFSVTKFIVSISISGVIIYSTGLAAGQINSIFGVDATSFPITYTFTTAIIVFNLIAPFLFVLSLGAILHLLNAIEWVRSWFKDTTYELAPYHSFVFPILASTIMYFGWTWSNNELSEERLPSKIYIMAHALDFNLKHECGNLKDGIPVVFIGASQKTVLADSYKLEDINFEKFFSSEVTIPKRFFRFECKIPNYGEK